MSDSDTDDRAQAEGLLAGVDGPADAKASTKGIASLPFMKRAAERDKQKALAEAHALLKELGAAGKDGDDDDDGDGDDPGSRIPGKGRMRFDGSGEDDKTPTWNNDDDSSDDDGDDGDDGGDGGDGDFDGANNRSKASPKPVATTAKSAAVRRSNTTNRTPGPQQPSAAVAAPPSNHANAALVAAAFADDADAAADFAALKRKNAEDELAMHDKALGRDDAEDAGFMPGWGAWGAPDGGKPAKLPAWVEEAAARAKKRKESYLKSRTDGRNAHAIITERADKKLGELQVAQVPHGYGNSARVYEAMMRQPLGRDWNSDTSFRNLTRPEVLTTKGVAIQPLKVGQTLVAEGAVMGHGTARSGVDASGAPLRRESAIGKKRAAAAQLRRKDVASKSLRRPFLASGDGGGL